jgi:hypothetical protein
VRPERERLFHEALDLYLFPYLFHGTETAAAARGLWGGLQLCQSGGAPAEARELAMDLTILYPGTPQAAEARRFLETNPPPKEIKQENENKR